MCHFWIISGYCAIFLSSNHLVLIAVDRFRIVFEGTGYLRRRTIRSVVVEPVTFLYFAAFCIYLPFMTNWEEMGVYEFSQETGKIVCRSKNTPMFVVISTLITMIFPGIILSRLYAKLVVEMKRSFERKLVKSIHSVSNSNIASSTAKPVILVDMKSSETESTGTTPTSNYLEVKETRDMERMTPERIMKRKVDLNEKRERRAAITLGILIALFLICYAPYCCLRLFEIFGHKIHSGAIRRFALGLGCINSGVNPIIYGIRNQDFRNAIKFIYDNYVVRSVT